MGAVFSSNQELERQAESQNHIIAEAKERHRCFVDEEFKIKYPLCLTNEDREREASLLVKIETCELSLMIEAQNFIIFEAKKRQTPSITRTECCHLSFMITIQKEMIAAAKERQKSAEYMVELSPQLRTTDNSEKNHISMIAELQKRQLFLVALSQKDQLFSMFEDFEHRLSSTLGIQDRRFSHTFDAHKELLSERVDIHIQKLRSEIERRQCSDMAAFNYRLRRRLLYEEAEARGYFRANSPDHSQDRSHADSPIITRQLTSQPPSYHAVTPSDHRYSDDSLILYNELDERLAESSQAAISAVAGIAWLLAFMASMVFLFIVISDQNNSQTRQERMDECLGLLSWEECKRIVGWQGPE